MIQIIAGEKGKGKTKILIDKVNADVNVVKGNIVYLDKCNQNMYELNNKIRLVNVRDYCVETPKEFIGFICGLIAGNHDLEKVYLDSFLKIACKSHEEVSNVIEKIDMISTKYNVDFVISLSMSEKELPESVKKFVVVSL